MKEDSGLHSNAELTTQKLVSQFSNTITFYTNVSVVIDFYFLALMAVYLQVSQDQRRYLPYQCTQSTAGVFIQPVHSIKSWIDWSYLKTALVKKGVLLRHVSVYIITVVYINIDDTDLHCHFLSFFLKNTSCNSIHSSESRIITLIPNNFQKHKNRPRFC